MALELGLESLARWSTAASRLVVVPGRYTLSVVDQHGAVADSATLTVGA